MTQQLIAISIAALIVLLMPACSLHSGKLTSPTSDIDQDGLVLSGQAMSITRGPTETHSENIVIQLNLTVTNVSKQTIIIYKFVSKHPSGEWVALTKENADRGDFHLLYDNRQARELSRKWVELRRAVDQGQPPIRHFRILKPGESFSQECEAWLTIPKEGYSVMDRKVLGWDSYKDKSNIWLRIGLTTWPLNLESGASLHSGRFDFGNKLRKKWRGYGYLWLWYLKSEIIELNLPESIFE